MWKLSCLALVVACSVPSVEASWDRADGTPYRCDGVVAALQPVTADPSIVAPWRVVAASPLTDASWLHDTARRARAALRHPVDMTVEERVRLQHQLIAVARRTDAARREAPSARAARDAHAAVMALIGRTAPTAEELATLGEPTAPRVEAILGPADEITQRATRTCGRGSLLHVAYARGQLAYRPLRAGTTRALVSQLIAYDTAGAPHVTPLLDGMELRLGNAVDSPACVIEATDDGRLEVAGLDTFHAHKPFVERRGDGVGCRSCHYSANAMEARDLTPAETLEIDEARTGQVERLAAATWKSLSEPLPRSQPR